MRDTLTPPVVPTSAAPREAVTPLQHSCARKRALRIEMLHALRVEAEGGPTSSRRTARLAPPASRQAAHTDVVHEGRRAAAHPAERRRQKRNRLSCEVTCVAAGGERFAGWARDIGPGGMRIQSDRRVCPGDCIAVFAVLPGTTEMLRLPAVVRWTRPGVFGVQFSSLRVRDTYAIASYRPRRG